MIQGQALTALLLLILAQPVVRAGENADIPRQPEAAAAPEKAAPLSPDPAMVTGQLDSGLRYIIRPTKEPEGRASARLFVNTGSLNETPENSGISHFLEHMVFNGSRHFKRGELIPAMEKLGLGFGGDANAYTSFLQTVYMLDLPNLDDETVNFALMILRDFADGATLEDEAIDHERGIVISELKSRDSESMRALIAGMRVLTPGTRLTDYMPIGQEDVIRNAPYSVVRDYYKNHYVPANMTLILTGDFTAQQAEAWVRKHFSGMEAREPEPRKPLEQLNDLGPCELVQPNTEQADVTISMSVVSPFKEKEDTLQQRIDDLPLALASDMLARRLARIAGKADTPFVSANGGKSGLLKASDVFSFQTVAHPERWKEALTRTEQELRSACEYGFSETELREAVMDITARLTQQCTEWETVSADDLASSIVDCLAENTLPTAPQEDLRAFQEGLKAIASDPDLCRRALAKEYDTSRVKLIATGTIPEGLTPENLRAAYNESLAQPAPKPEVQEEIEFAYDNPGDPGTVVEQGQIEDLGVTTLRLSNGVRLNLKPTDFSKGSISITAAVDGGRLVLPTTPGLPSMLSSVMNHSGLELHSQDDLKRLLSGKLAGVSFGLSDTRLLFSGDTNANDFEFQCKLIVASILHPSFGPEGEELLRRKMPAFYQRLETTPDGAFAEQSARLLFNGDPRFCVPTREQMLGMNRQQARDSVEPFLKDGAIEVTVVGDFKAEEILPALLRSFGAMPARKAEFTPIPDNNRSVTMAPWGKREFLRYKTDLDKTIVSQVYFAGDGRNYKRNRRLALLASIAREKLFDGLRAAMGQSYSPSVRFTSNEEFNDAAFFTGLSFGVKGNRELVDSAMFSIFSGLGEGAIDDTDFECAIRPMLANAEKVMRTNGFWSSGLLYTQSDPGQLDRIRDLRDDLRSITADEIRALAKEVFGSRNPDHFFTVPEDIETPAPEQPDNAGSDTPAVEKSAPAPAVPSVAYTILVSKETAALPEWREVVSALADKYRAKGWKVTVEELPDFSKERLATSLRNTQARYAAAVMRPQEVTRPVVAALHRASRMVDDDPWGDCIWGIVTGYKAADALRIARTDKPLVIKRLLGTTNVGPAPFEQSFCITDWSGFPVLEQSGYTEPTQTTYTPDTPKGKEIHEQGIQGLFAERLEKMGAQLLVTSSHATQYNLEMPFSMGLVFPYENRFYNLPRTGMGEFMKSLGSIMQSGSATALKPLAEKCTPIVPDGTPRVWLAAGNCLIGDAAGNAGSMAVTALSAYTCNQFVGYTVPSWFGEAGWGTLSCFFDNTDGTSLAEAFFLNNQFLLDKSMRLDPKSLDIEFDDSSRFAELMTDIRNAGLSLKSGDDVKQIVGLIHDRDVLAFYGDPAWSATVDSSHSARPFRIEWQDAKTFTITANDDHKGRCAVFFPTAETGYNAQGCNVENAVLTNDFILFPELDLHKGESLTVTIK